jgi:hypothetical protein
MAALVQPEDGNGYIYSPLAASRSDVLGFVRSQLV